MSEQENKPYPEEIEAEKENLSEQLILLDDGRTVEFFYDANSNEPRRFYIRGQNGEITEFSDLREPNDDYDYKYVQQKIAEKTSIVVTDREAKKITDKLYEMDVKNEMDDRKVLE